MRTTRMNVLSTSAPVGDEVLLPNMRVCLVMSAGLVESAEATRSEP